MWAASLLVHVAELSDKLEIDERLELVHELRNLCRDIPSALFKAHQLADKECIVDCALLLMQLHYVTLDPAHLLHPLRDALEEYLSRPRVHKQGNRRWERIAQGRDIWIGLGPAAGICVRAPY